MRAPNLTAKDVAWIIQLIDGWTGRLTWKALVEAIRLHRQTGYTRSALSRHDRIQRAYTLRKQSGPEPELPRQTYTQQIRSSLASERARCQGLERELDNITERILTIMVNASHHGLTEEQLLRPLPKIDRGSRRRRAGAEAPPTPVCAMKTDNNAASTPRLPGKNNAGPRSRLRVVPPPTP